jgi:hypothetical protein
MATGSDVMTIHLMRANTSESLGMIFVKPDTTGDSIKLLVQTRLQAIVPSLRCVYNGMLLGDADTVSGAEIADNGTVMVIDPAAEAEGNSMSGPAVGGRRSRSRRLRRRQSRRVQ